MPADWVEAKRQAVLKYRNMFLYSTAAQEQQSASDALIQLMCSYATFGAPESS